jgi:exodeoxyribonuclease VII small subunit
MSTKPNQDYTSMQRELDEILENLQREDLDIEVALKSYERGMELVDEMQSHLDKVQNKVKKIQAEQQDSKKS